VVFIFMDEQELRIKGFQEGYKKLVDEFGFKHVTIGEKMGKSREYVTNSLRLLSLPEDMLEALKVGKITEGHSRPLLMLGDRPEEQQTLFKEIMLRRMTVREAERIARHIALEKARIKGDLLDPVTKEAEEKLGRTLQTRVFIEKKNEGPGGRITIAYFSDEELKKILDIIHTQASESPIRGVQGVEPEAIADTIDTVVSQEESSADPVVTEGDEVAILDDRSSDEVEKAENVEDDEEVYSIKNFSI
jgi:uncharacterized protein YfeS